MPKPQDVKRLNENTRAKASAVKLEVAVSVISGYEPGKGEGAKTKAAAFKLSSNENPLGASVRALKALRATRVPSERYPDSRLQAVKSSVAEAYGLDASNLVFGNGSDELSALVCTLFLAPGDEAIAGEHSFLLYRSQVLAAGGVPVLIRERAHKLSVADVAACASRKTKLVFVTSPANPMGAILTRREVLALARKLPAGCALLVDMAYADYVVDDRHVFTDVKAGDNVVFTHTLSKLYGLAHLRVGWMHAPARYALAANKIKSPFNVNGVAQALACAAVEDGGHKALSASFNMFWVSKIACELRAKRMLAGHPHGSFVVAKFPKRVPVAALEALIASRGAVVRSVTEYGVFNAVRASLGCSRANARLSAILASTFSFKLVLETRASLGLACRTWRIWAA